MVQIMFSMLRRRHPVMVLACLLLLGCPAAALAQQPQTVKDVNNVRDLTLDSLEKVRQARIAPGKSRRGDHPVLFLIGNSTMRNGTLGNGNNGQWGWGYFAEDYFDKTKISVENQALGGTSSRTFYRRLWPEVRQALRPGDWVIISIGHNDNGPLDKGRARASLIGTGEDSLLVNVQEIHGNDTTYRPEMVYTYGGYLRHFVREVRQAGAHPILMSLTPKKYRTADGSHLRGDEHKYGQWAATIAREMNVPFVDLNAISTKKLESYSRWKCDYHFYGDNIHTSAFGARLNARSAAEGLIACEHPEVLPLKAMMMPLTTPTVDVQRHPGRPVVFITGDSTVKNNDKDDDGMWGWGAFAQQVLDTKKVTPVNCAKAGRSLRSYLNEGRWDKVCNSIQPGDYVLIPFGHNDLGNPAGAKARNEINAVEDTCHVYKMEGSGRYELVYSFGWYLRKYIDDVRERGGKPVIVSLTPRNIWKDGKIERRNDTYGQMYRAVAAETATPFIDLHNIAADRLDKMGQKKATACFNHDHTHMSKAGASAVAKDVAKAFKKLLKEEAKTIKNN